MSGPGSGGPFYFSWVAASATTFSAANYVYDETIFAFSLKHSEGQIPTLELEIENPGVGLLSAGRKQWAWFAWWDGATMHPLFFGRLVGVPTNLTAQVVTIQIIARANNYISLKQAAAETLKVAPYYDPVFLDDAHRDDADSILEAYASAWHVDRLSLAWTASDIISGEDGTVSFSGANAFYSSLQIAIKEPPLTAIRVNAVAKWSQVTTGGSVALGPWVFETYSGSSLLADWPKPGASLGGGWLVQASSALDVCGIENAIPYSSNYSWQNLNEDHNEGDTMSVSITQSNPVFTQDPPRITLTLSRTVVTAGILDGQGNPNASSAITYLWIPQYTIIASLYLQYQANRQRSETLTFLLQSDLQPVLTDPTVQQDSEVIALNTVDLSAPLMEPRDWTVLAGTTVAAGQICLPNNPVLPGGTAYQICVTPGTCGATEPVFSDLPGVTATDGSAVWASLGPNLPAIPDWKASTAAGLGTLIAPTTPPWIYYSALLPPVTPYRTCGAQVEEGMVIRADNDSSFQICTISGATGWLTKPNFSPVWGVPTSDGSAQWTSLGPVLPSGAIHMCIQAGTTALQIPPPFSAIAGNVTVDNGVHWLSLGAGGPSISIPAGGLVGNVTARSYFPTTRGLQSLEYLIMKARARLLTRARAVEVSWQSPFAMGVALSCRMNATIYDGRLPGGTATGKIIDYELSGDGARGEFLTHVKIGCALGNGGAATGAAGSPTYVNSGYVAGGYQQMTGATFVVSSSDVGYAPPLDDPNDDGLIFPLDASQVVLSQAVIGSAATQSAAILAAYPAIIAAQNLMNPPLVDPYLATPTSPPLSPSANIEAILATAGNSVYLDLQLKPVTGSAFETAYAVATTPLSVPKMIDLGAV